MPFSSLDTDIQPEEFPGFAEAARELAPGSGISIVLERQIDTGSLRTGTSSLQLGGELVRDPSGNLSFEGEVFGRTEIFNFDKPGFANAVGRRLPGRPFDVRFVGSRPVRFPE